MCATLDRSELLPSYAARGRYYLPMPQGKVLSVRLARRSYGAGLVCGISFSVSARDLEFIREYGAPDCFCTARIGRRILCENDISLAFDAAYDFFFTFSHADSCTVKKAVDHRRRSLVCKLSASLRPLGYAKRKNDWIGPQTNGTYPVLHLSHIPEDDRFSFCHVRSPFPRYCADLARTEVFFEGMTCFDWQVLDPAELAGLTEAVCRCCREQSQPLQ